MLLLVIVTGVTAVKAQNLIGYSSEKIEVFLENKNIEFNRYFSVSGDLCYEFYNEGEYRIYVINPKDVCETYMVFSNSDDFIYAMRKYCISKKLTQTNYGNGSYLYKNINITVTIGNVSELNVDSEKITDYIYYSIISTTK